ncbi:hypothetical protein [Sphaerisporangium album]|nr:hypothetical protein [Sphaerisporangium album]
MTTPDQNTTEPAKAAESLGPDIGDPYGFGPGAWISVGGYFPPTTGQRTRERPQGVGDALDLDRPYDDRPNSDRANSDRPHPHRALTDQALTDRPQAHRAQTGRPNTDAAHSDPARTARPDAGRSRAGQLYAVALVTGSFAEHAVPWPGAVPRAEAAAACGILATVADIARSRVIWMPGVRMCQDCAEVVTGRANRDQAS